MKFIVLVVFTTLHSLLSAQTIKPAERLILGDSIVFMGIDLSSAKFYDPERVTKGIYIRDRHGLGWCQIADNIFKADIKFDLQKKFVSPMLAVFDSSYQWLDSTWIIEDAYKGISDEDIKLHVKRYPVNSSQRLGIVILIDQMHVVTKMVNICVAYIDLNSKEVIKVIRAEGPGSGYGYTAFWKTGIENAYHDFIAKDDKYLKELKKFFK